MKRTNLLSTRIISIIIIVFAFLLVMYVLTMIYNSKESVKETVGEQTITTANNILNFINPEQYKELAKNPVEGDLYLELREQLNELREINGVLYAYTFMVPKEGEEVKFLVDGMPIDDDENAASLGEISTATTYEDLQKVIKDGYFYSDLLSSDYGEFISGTVPIKDTNGEVVAFLGIDIDASYVNTVSTSIVKEIVPRIGVLFLIIMVVSLFVIYRYTNKALKPLEALKSVSKQISVGDFKEANATLSALHIKANNEISVFAKEFTSALHHLSNSLSTVYVKSKNLEQVVHNINDVANQVTHSNNAIANSLIEIEASSEFQQESNYQVISALNEMTIGIQQLADTNSEVAVSSDNMTKLIESSVENANTVVAEIGNVETSVLQTEQYVREMGEKFNSIKDMVSVITSIADQTNLLACSCSNRSCKSRRVRKRVRSSCRRSTQACRNVA